MAYDKPGPPQYIFLSFTILITFYLIFLYIKSKAFHTYSCYNIVIMSFVLFCGGVLNICVPAELDSAPAKFVWGFLKDVFNKLIISILTMQIIISYIGIIKTEFYYSKEKLIFILGIISCLGASLIVGAVINSIKVCNGYYNYYYKDKQKQGSTPKCEDEDKRFISIILIEVIFCGIVLAISVFCLAVVLSYLTKKIKEAKEGLIEDLGYKKQLIRFIFIFILNIHKFYYKYIHEIK